MIVNADHSTLQYCNGTSWISMSPPSDDRCISGALSNSDRGVLVCSDGAIYAGEYNGHYLFAWPADEPTTLQYKSPRSGGALGSNSADDGVANTNVQMSIDPALFFAAKACRDKGEQWYLPAVNELDILNKAQGIGLFSGTYRILGSWYWSSTGASGTNTTARSFNFTNENLSWPYMDDSLQVRCVRRRPAFTSGVCSGPDGTVGDIIYNDDHRVMQWCDANGWKLLGSVATGELTDTNVLSGLTGHWKLNDGSGLTATDSSGLGSHGTLMNMDESTDWVSGKIGGALDFDGDNDYVTTSFDDGVHDNLPAISGCLWFFSDINQSRRVAGWQRTAPNQEIFVPAAMSLNSGAISASVRLGGGVGLITVTTPDMGAGYWNNQWYHVCTVFDKNLASGRLKIYVNGKILAQHDAGNATVDYNDATMNAIFDIARNPSSGTRFNGKIDDVRIYNRALSANEVQIIHTMSACASPAAPQGEMIYNADHNIMQYCNGSDWVGIGKSP